MKSTAKGFIPILLALFVVASFSYKIFTSYKPSFLASVRGTADERIGGSVKNSYIQSIPLPVGSKEVGSNYSAVSEQLTAKVAKSPEYILRFYRGVLSSKGWTVKTDGSESGGQVVFIREGSTFSVSVLTYDDKETVYSLTYNPKK